MVETKNSNPRIKDESTIIHPVPTITLSPDDLQGMVRAAVEGALGAKEAKTSIAPPPSAVSLTNAINQRLMSGQQFFKRLHDAKDYVPIQIPSLYRPFTGRNITASINGSYVKVPVDGKTYWVSPAHFMAIQEKLRFLSEKAGQQAENAEVFGPDVGDFSKIQI